ncbi:MAG: hypothetical protein HQ555_11190 [Candidatus Aminicenantes bacterium]|nr:hypothetical protein [Candidatus Aminicenantes bacterium]
MKRRLFVFLILILILESQFQSFAQFKQEELAERTKWEEFLKTAKIVNQDQPLSEREAVTEPWRLTLEKDGITKHGWWKNVEGRRKGYIEGWKWEIAAYRLDKLLGLNMVPPTVEKRFRGDRGSCMLDVEYKMMYRDKVGNDIPVPSHKVRDYNRTSYLQKAWDNLVANEDRNMGDILYTEDWRMILIDHSRTFRTSRKYTKKLIHVKKGKKDREPIKELPRIFVEKLKVLTFELIKNAVGEYLTEKEINAVLARRDLILKEINRLIKDYGENKVLY